MTAEWDAPVSPGAPPTLYEVMDDTDPLAERLRDLGRRPVDPATASQHLTAMASAGSRPRTWTRAKVGAAFFAGLLVGGTGLASAGALPGSVQDAAHTTLAQVGVQVPDGHGPTRSTVGCGGVTYKNHGQFVKAQKDKAAAAAQPCGKPVQAGTETPGATEAPEAPEPTEAPDTGKPANPGAKGKGHAKGHGNGNSQGQDGQGQDEQGSANGSPASTEAPTVAPKAAPAVPAPTTTSTTSTTAAPTTTTSSTTSTTR